MVDDPKLKRLMELQKQREEIDPQAEPVNFFCRTQHLINR